MSCKESLVKKLRNVLDQEKWDENKPKTIVVLSSRQVSADTDLNAQINCFRIAKVRQTIPVYFTLPKTIMLRHGHMNVFVSSPTEAEYHFAYLECDIETTEKIAAEILKQSWEMLDSTDKEYYSKFTVTPELLKLPDVELAFYWGKDHQYRTVYGDSLSDGCFTEEAATIFSDTTKFAYPKTLVLEYLLYLKTFCGE